ncbi:MAG: hypothetical protein L6R45_32420 [Anaerolineae bacterium]|nr:hypothetical protein [Anaerolineae bacterium]
MTTLHTDTLFAPLDTDLHLERIGGGNETEVYTTDDRRFVVKVKCDSPSEPASLFHQAQTRRTAAEAFASAVGPEHSLPTYYLIACNNGGQAQLVAVQPYLRQASPLAQVNYADLSTEERRHLAAQLRQLIRRALNFYCHSGQMPDLYGRTHSSPAERRRLNRWFMLPWRLWCFFFRRTLLRSHNLMLTAAQPRDLLLVDYDPVQRSPLYRRLYYTARCLLFGRDYLFIWLMERFGYNPHG